MQNSSGKRLATDGGGRDSTAHVSANQRKSVSTTLPAAWRSLGRYILRAAGDFLRPLNIQRSLPAGSHPVCVEICANTQTSDSGWRSRPLRHLVASGRRRLALPPKQMECSGRALEVIPPKVACPGRAGESCKALNQSMQPLLPIYKSSGPRAVPRIVSLTRRSFSLEQNSKGSLRLKRASNFLNRPRG